MHISQASRDLHQLTVTLAFASTARHVLIRIFFVIIIIVIIFTLHRSASRRFGWPALRPRKSRRNGKFPVFPALFQERHNSGTGHGRQLPLQSIFQLHFQRFSAGRRQLRKRCASRVMRRWHEIGKHPTICNLILYTKQIKG